MSDYTIRSTSVLRVEVETTKKEAEIDEYLHDWLSPYMRGADVEWVVGYLRFYTTPDCLEAIMSTVREYEEEYPKDE